MRVYHSLDDGSHTFQSLIVTPSMTGGEVLRLVVSRLSTSEDPLQYYLLLKTATAGWWNCL